MSKNISEKVLYQGQWLSLVEIEYETHKSERLQWECVRRTRSSVTAVIVARLKPSDRFVLIKQYRPATDGYVLGFPVGLSTGHRDDALRELKEETGYSGTIKDISPILNSHAGLINDPGMVVYAEVDETLPENQSPQQELEPGEDITVHLIKAEDLRHFIQKESGAGTHISPGLWYLFGLGPI
ncbi:MAG: NUDIX hydrolase, partial [Sedimentisphaerales bacterium]|nr:NUDIX hydrolase [Sedimentisphaerales bacterium]